MSHGDALTMLATAALELPTRATSEMVRFDGTAMSGGIVAPISRLGTDMGRSGRPVWQCYGSSVAPPT